MMRSTVSASAVLLCLAFALSSAGADSGAKFGLSDPNAPIYLSADRFDADQNTKTLVYSGNAVVRQGDVHLRTDVLRVIAPDGHTPDKIYAEGHVVVTSSTGTATGDRAVYDVNPRLILLTGHVVLTHQENVMRGEKLNVNLISGKADLGGAASGGRVQGLFTPRSLSARTDGGK